jgi:hypothetical protein
MASLARAVTLFVVPFWRPPVFGVPGFRPAISVSFYCGNSLDEYFNLPLIKYARGIAIKSAISDQVAANAWGSMD